MFGREPGSARLLCCVAVPELPEVETVRRSLVPVLIGRTVTDVSSSGLPLRRGVDLAAWRARVVGRKCDALERRGKYLIGRFGAGAIVLHLGMSGRIVVADRGQPRPRHCHLTMELDDGREVRFVDPRRFGIAVALQAAELEAYPPLATLGADPLGSGLIPALEGARRSASPARSVLLDQRVVAGLGNIYATEALFRAAIHPATPFRRIGRERVVRLAKAVVDVLEAALRSGGTTLADGGFVDGLGEVGYFAVELAVYAREGKACPRCGGTIRRRVLGGRSAFYCPRCQRG